MTKISTFIPHIAGLRGIAVLLVLLQHFGVPGFDGGFIGVDIFFVISGFLITGILVDEYSKFRDPESRIGTISLKGFYLRRVRRILPAALVVTISIVIFSWFVNNTSRFSVIAGDAIWTTLFSANLNFAFKSTDYFQIGAAPSPFQHFWSLSVEEQFYFLWPALMLMALSLGALKFRGKIVSWQSRLSALFWVTTIASLVFMMVTFYFQPSLSYFLTASRAWELSAGALAAIAIRSDHSSLKFLRAKFVQHLPLPLLVISLFLVRAENFGYTMPLVIFAAVIMVSKPADSLDLDAKLLSSKVLMFVGNISYSLYLWHWPVITFGTELGYADSLLGKVGLAAIAFALATLSYYFVELKFQRIPLPKFYANNSVPLSKPLWVSASSALAVALLVIPSAAVQPNVQSYVASYFKAAETSPLPSIDPKPTESPEGPGAAGGGTPETSPNPTIDPKPTKSPDWTGGESSAPKPTKSPEATGIDWLARRHAEIRRSNSAIAAAGKLSEEQISEIIRVEDGKSYAQGFDFTCGWGECTLGSPNAGTKILLIGDSHGLMYQSTLSHMRKSGLDLYVKSFNAPLCANFSGTRSLSKELDAATNDRCDTHHRNVLAYVDSTKLTYDYIILSDSLNFEPSNYIEDAVDFATRVKVAGKKTVVLGQAPVATGQSACLNKDYSNYMDCSVSRPTSIHDIRVAKGAKVAYGNIGSLFCLQSYCPLIIGASPTVARDHLTDVAGAQIAPYFMEFLKDSRIPKK